MKTKLHPDMKTGQKGFLVKGCMYGFWMLICGLLGTGFFIPIQAQTPYPDSRFETVSGLRIHLRHKLPEDTPVSGRVVLLHGFACSTYSWRYTLPALVKAGYEVVAIDMPPFGYSDRPKKRNLSFSAQADIVWRVLDQIGGSEPWHVVGHSMGAATAGAMAALYPDRLESVVYLDGIIFNSGKGPLHSVQWLLRPKPLVWPVSWLGQWFVISRRRVKYVLSRAYGRPASREEVARYLHPLKRAGTARGVIDMFAYARPIFPYSTDSIQVPGLIIWGERDLIPMREARALKNQLLDVDLITIPEAAHCPMETHPNTFHRILTGFLDQASSKISSESK